MIHSCGNTALRGRDRVLADLACVPCAALRVAIVRKSLVPRPTVVAVIDSPDGRTFSRHRRHSNRPVRRAA